MKISELPGIAALYQWLQQRLIDRDYGCIIGREGLGKSVVVQHFAAEHNTSDWQIVIYHQATLERSVNNSLAKIKPRTETKLIAINEPYYWLEARYTLKLLVEFCQAKKIATVITGDPAKMLNWLNEDYAKIVVNKYDFPVASMQELFNLAVALEKEYLGKNTTPWHKSDYRQILEIAEGSAIKLKDILEKIFHLVCEWQAPVKSAAQFPLVLPAARQVLGKELAQWGSMPW